MHSTIRTMLIFCLVCLSACTAATPQATATSSPTPVPPTPIPSATATITNTPMPQPSDTPASTTTATATATASEMPTLIPKPVTQTEWKDIPIMPGAYNGSGDDNSFSYLIKIPAQQVKEYYDKELPKIGWGLFATGTTDGSDYLMLMYQKGSAMMTITVVVEGDAVSVLIIQP